MFSAAIRGAFALAGSLAVLLNGAYVFANAAASKSESELTSPCPEGVLDCPPSGHASFTAGIARIRKVEKDACVAPFRRVVVPAVAGHGHSKMLPATFKCVLDADATMIDTIQVDSFTTVDCQDHKLTPWTLGTPGNLNLRSDPEVAFFLNESYGVKITNCIIDGFDFGVFGINSKLPSEFKSNSETLAALRNKILSNTINVRFYPVYLYSTDNTEIENNTASFSSAGGLGISVFFDSDLNTIRNNVVTSNIGSSPLDGAPAVPGPIIPGNSSNPSFFSQSVGIVVAHFGANPSLLSAVIGGNLYQLTVPNSSVDADRSEDNLVEGNIITFNGTETAPPPNGIGSAQALRSEIRGNTIIRGNTGIVIAGAIGAMRNFPGSCSLDSARLCLIDDDCNISGFDLVSKGMCVGATLQAVNLPSKDVVVEQNILTGPFALFGINVPNAASELLISDNSVAGPALGAGIRLAGPSMQNDTNNVTRNTVSNVGDAIRLEKMGATSFGAKFSLNDFTGYDVAVRTSNDYDLPSELSVNGHGNYWGLLCPGFNPNLILRLNGTINANVVDSHPYDVPVANLTTPPTTCP